jgi:isopenicillin-N epimerase
VLDAAERWRGLMEANPDRFFRDVLPTELRRAAGELARFVGADAASLALVDNATTALNAVLRSLEFRPGDEILVNSHSYGALRQVARYVCKRTGAKLVEPHVPLPSAGAAALVAALAPAFSSRTRLVVIDHISSPTGLVWPVTELVALARSHGAQVLIDGAHAPGQLELDVPALGADWYVGNGHKWLFAPRGCGFLWSRAQTQAAIHPATISHGYGSGFTAEFDWTGTRDFSPWLAIDAALRFLHELGAARVRRYCHELVARAAQEIERAWQEPLAAEAALHASMMAIRLPRAWQQATAATREAAAKLQSAILRQHRIAVAIMAIDGTLWARISAQVYNEPADYERLLALGVRGPS